MQKEVVLNTIREYDHIYNITINLIYDYINFHNLFSTTAMEHVDYIMFGEEEIDVGIIYYDSYNNVIEKQLKIPTSYLWVENWAEIELDKTWKREKAEAEKKQKEEAENIACLEKETRRLQYEELKKEFEDNNMPTSCINCWDGYYKK